jgi:signal transduction histidine kinase
MEIGRSSHNRGSKRTSRRDDIDTTIPKPEKSVQPHAGSDFGYVSAMSEDLLVMEEATSGRPLRMSLPMAVAVVGLSAVTVVAVTSPRLASTVEAANVLLQIEAVGLLVAVMTCGLAYFRYSSTGSRSSWALSLTFLVLGVNHLLFGVLIEPARLGVAASVEGYFFMAGRLLAAGVLLVGMATEWPHLERFRTRQLGFLLPASVLIGILWVVGALLWLERDVLPVLSVGGEGLGLAGLTPTDVSLGLLGTGLFLMGAFLFLRAEDRPLSTWISISFVFAAFSHLHYMFSPTAFTDRISTGDLLWTAFFVFLFLGLMVEVRRIVHDERDRALELGAAYEAEQHRVVELEEADRARAELFGILTHELINPVSVLRGFTSTLVSHWDRFTDDTRRDMIRRMDRESERLRNLADEASTTSLLESGRFLLAVREESAVEMAREASEMLGHLDGRLRLHVDPSGESAIILADPARLLQVFRNLLLNAGKYSPPDAPVELNVIADEHDVTFSVVDHGDGIPQEDLTRLFHRFVRLHLPGHDQVPGSGLGLYISRRIVEAHGGHMWVESADGSGATFAFALPRAGLEP